jgi:hypothetical protein
MTNPLDFLSKSNKAYLECGLTGSIGDSVYTQTLNPEGQMNAMIKIFQPLADRNLLLGLLSGNHEQRIFKTSGVDICKMMCRILAVPYLSMARWNWFKVGKQNYSVYAMHGATGSTFAHTKLKAAADAARSFRCDVFAMGHTHDLVSNVVEEQALSYQNKTVIYKRKLLLVCGHYLGYDLSYAQAKGYQIGKTGSPSVKFSSERHAFYI